MTDKFIGAVDVDDLIFGQTEQIVSQR